MYRFMYNVKVSKHFNIHFAYLSLDMHIAEVNSELQEKAIHFESHFPE